MQAVRGGGGLAVTTTVAAARITALLRGGHCHAAALAGGFHDVFAITGSLALAAALVTATLVGRARPAAPAAEPPACPSPAEAARARTEEPSQDN